MKEFSEILLFSPLLLKLCCEYRSSHAFYYIFTIYGVQETAGLNKISLGIYHAVYAICTQSTHSSFIQIGFASQLLRYLNPKLTSSKKI